MAVSSQAALHSALAAVPLFAGLPAADLLELTQKLTPQRFARDEVILLQGDSHGDLHIVEGGSVRVVLTSPDGREVVLALLGPGEFFGELALLDGLPGSAEVIAQEDCSLLRLRREHFRAFLRSHPDTAEALLAVLSRRIRDTNTLVYDTTFRDVPSRLANAIVKLAASYGRKENDGIVIGLRLTQEALASMIGSSRISINKHLKHWERQGLIRSRNGVIKVLDLEKLWQDNNLGEYPLDVSQWVS
jgi:CRP/FNR family cyclic AMP-dependent transcriptional regulator